MFGILLKRAPLGWSRRRPTLRQEPGGSGEPRELEGTRRAARRLFAYRTRCLGTRESEFLGVGCRNSQLYAAFVISPALASRSDIFRSGRTLTNSGESEGLTNSKELGELQDACLLTEPDGLPAGEL